MREKLIANGLDAVIQEMRTRIQGYDAARKKALGCGETTAPAGL